VTPRTGMMQQWTANGKQVSFVKTLVVGIGNPIRGDDGVGPVVAEAICSEGRLGDGGGCEWLAFTGSGLDLLGAMHGFERVVIIDSVAGDRIGEGECCRVDLPGMETEGTWSPSAHNIGIVDALRLAGHLRVPLPEMRFYGIGVKAADAYREGLSEALARRVPAIVATINDDLRKDGAGR